MTLLSSPGDFKNGFSFLFGIRGVAPICMNFISSWHLWNTHLYAFSQAKFWYRSSSTGLRMSILPVLDFYSNLTDLLMASWSYSCRSDSESLESYWEISFTIIFLASGMIYWSSFSELSTTKNSCFSRLWLLVFFLLHSF